MDINNNIQNNQVKENQSLYQKPNQNNIPNGYHNLKSQPIVQINSQITNPKQYQQPIKLSTSSQSSQISFSLYKLKYKYQQAINNFTSSLYYITIFIVMTVLIMLVTLHLTNTYHLTIAQLGIYASYISWGLSIIAIMCSIYYFIMIKHFKQKLHINWKEV